MLALLGVGVSLMANSFILTFDTLLVEAKYISQLELFVLWKVVELWGNKLRRKNILMYCDHKTTVDCLWAGVPRSEFSQCCL